jgi:hypothetical protein
MAAAGTHGFQRIWLVLCDHSVVGVWKTRLEAERAVRLRQRQTISNVVHFLLGPFVLRHGASAEKRAPEWISRCSCGATYRRESEWVGLAYVGVMDFDDGLVLELRNCVACGSTISRRVSLKKGSKRQ